MSSGLNLKLCPFCGGVAKIVSHEEWPDCGKPKTYYGIQCETTGCWCSDADYIFESESEAIELWNRRGYQKGGTMKKGEKL